MLPTSAAIGWGIAAIMATWFFSVLQQRLTERGPGLDKLPAAFNEYAGHIREIFGLERQ